jgi:hypothetical protein
MHVVSRKLRIGILPTTVPPVTDASTRCAASPPPIPRRAVAESLHYPRDRSDRNFSPTCYLPAVRKAIENTHGRSLRTLNGGSFLLREERLRRMCEWDSLDDAVAFYKSKALLRLNDGIRAGAGRLTIRALPDLCLGITSDCLESCSGFSRRILHSPLLEPRHVRGFLYCCRGTWPRSRQCTHPPHAEQR